jgi:hypothetical protein
MRRFLAALLGMLIGYPVFAVAGYFLIGVFSHNHFDGSVEASMTAAFVCGPAGAIIGLILGSVAGKKKPVSADAPSEKVLAVELKPK